MELAKFRELWNKWSLKWLKTAIEIDGKEKTIACLCRLNEDAVDAVYKNYNIIKDVMKDTYFRQVSQTPPKLNRYKRAAVIAYAIIKSDPLVVIEKPMDEDIYFLKQRLAFFMALGSILQDFDKDQVAGKKVFSIFNGLGERDHQEGNDGFLMSIYKDMFYSELYNNYNILTMANVFGLLIENAAGFDQLKTVDNV